MCAEHSILRKNSNKGLIHANTATYTSLYMYDQLPRNVYKCTSPMTNDL